MAFHGSMPRASCALSPQRWLASQEGLQSRRDLWQDKQSLVTWEKLDVESFWDLLRFFSDTHSIFFGYLNHFFFWFLIGASFRSFFLGENLKSHNRTAICPAWGFPWVCPEVTRWAQQFLSCPCHQLWKESQVKRTGKVACCNAWKIHCLHFEVEQMLLLLLKPEMVYLYIMLERGGHLVVSTSVTRNGACGMAGRFWSNGFLIGYRHPLVAWSRTETRPCCHVGYLGMDHHSVLAKANWRKFWILGITSILELFRNLRWDFSMRFFQLLFFYFCRIFLTFPWRLLFFFWSNSQDLGLRVPGDAFQISTLEAHDAMVKFGSMPQILAALLRCRTGMIW